MARTGGRDLQKNVIAYHWLSCTTSANSSSERLTHDIASCDFFFCSSAAVFKERHLWLKLRGRLCAARTTVEVLLHRLPEPTLEVS